MRQGHQAPHHPERLAVVLRLARCLPHIDRAAEARALLSERLRQAEASASAAGLAAEGEAFEALRLALAEIDRGD